MEPGKKIAQSAKFIQSKTEIVPKVGIILGSGLGNLAKLIDSDVEIHYSKIPNFRNI